MRVIMVMIVSMVVRVIVTVIVPAMRIVHMVMSLRRRRRIGAAFRLERRVDQRNLGAKRCQQRCDCFIAPRPYAIG